MNKAIYTDVLNDIHFVSVPILGLKENAKLILDLDYYRKQLINRVFTMENRNFTSLAVPRC